LGEILGIYANEIIGGRREVCAIAEEEKRRQLKGDVECKGAGRGGTYRVFFLDINFELYTPGGGVGNSEAI
jgi:hypothetical protein